MYFQMFKDQKQFRLPSHDYSSNGYYFVTICAKKRKEFFGEIKNGIMGLNEVGLMVYEEWHKTSQLRPYIKLDEFIVMPNHVHGIIIIDNPSVGTRRGAFLQDIRYNKFQPLIPKSLSSVINHFKGAIANWCNKNGHNNFAWQPRFWDRVIRDENELNRIREYIHYNPYKWELDRNNPENLWM